MKNISKLDKEIINGLSTQDLNKISSSLNILSKFLIKSNIGLYLSENDEIFILSKDENTYKEVITNIVDLLSLLCFLQEENMIYCLKDDNSSYFLHNTLTDNHVAQENEDSKRYIVENGYLYIKDFKIKYTDKSGKIISKGKKCSKQISEKLAYYLKSYIYPTSLLNSFIKNEYLSIEELSYKKEIRDAKRSRDLAFVSLIITIFITPFIELLINNKYGKSELKSEQYSTIKKGIEQYNGNLYRIVNINTELYDSTKKKLDIISDDINIISRKIND